MSYDPVADALLELFGDDDAKRVIAEAGNLARAYRIGNAGFDVLLAEAMVRRKFNWTMLSITLAMNRKALAVAMAMRIEREQKTEAQYGGRIGRLLRGED